MNYIEISTARYPVSERDIKLEYPNTSFAEPFVPPEAYAAVFASPQPAYDPVTQVVLEAAPEATPKGTYEQRWVVTPRYTSHEEEAAAAAADAQAKQAALIASYDTALTAHLNATAQAKRYDDRVTCMVRAGFAGPFQAEGQAFATWADTCNMYAYTMLQAVQAGSRPSPASVEAFIAELPAMVWPS